MRLYKRGAKWWADLRAEGLGRVPTGCTEKGEARKAAKRLLDGGAAGKTFGQALDKAWAEHYAGTKGARNAESIHNQLKAAMGAEQLDRVTTPRIRRFSTEQLEAGAKGTTVNRKLAHIGKTLKLACEWGWLDSVPHIPRQSERSQRHRELTSGEEADLMVVLAESATHGWLGGLCAFLLGTGARLGEALAITEIDRQRALDSGSWTIWVNKGDRPRAVPLNTVAFDALDRWSWKGRTPRQAQKAWEWARARLGLVADSGFVLHCLRHTAASRMVQRGVPLVTVKEVLGHSTVAVTQRYAVANSDNLKSAVAVLDSVPTGATKA